MKPFNLERALAGDPVVTRSGVTVTEIAHLSKLKSVYNLAVVIGTRCCWYSSDGRRMDYATNEDLFMTTVKKTYWVNIYKDINGNPCAGVVHNAKEIADLAKAKDGAESYVGTYPIEIEE